MTYQDNDSEMHIIVNRKEALILNMSECQWTNILDSKIEL